MEATEELEQRFPKCHDQLKTLQEALAIAGIKLPGLQLDPQSFQDGDGIPLFQLGRCNMQTAQALVTVLWKGAP
jgi:hypothetical protein